MFPKINNCGHGMTVVKKRENDRQLDLTSKMTWNGGNFWWAIIGEKVNKVWVEKNEATKYAALRMCLQVNHTYFLWVLVM